MKLLIGRTSRRILALFLTAVSVFAAFGLRTSTTRTVRATEAEPTATATAGYVKVTSAPADWSGRYLIVYEAKSLAFDGSLATLDAVGNSVAVTITDGVISDDFSANECTIATIEGGYSIQAKSGKYIGQTSDTNGLESENTAYVNTISLSADGSVDIVSGGAYLRYNATSNQTRFRYYKSSSYTGQKAISLYKYVDDINGVCEHTETTTTTKKEANCTEDGLKETVCNECGNVTNTEVLPATGHTWVDGVCSVCGIPKPKTVTFTKITANQTDWSGKYLIVYEAGNIAFNGGNTQEISAKNNALPVEISDDEIVAEVTGDLVQAYFTITPREGGYSIQSQSGFYIGRATSTEGLDSDKDTVALNTISYDEEKSKVVITATGTGTLQHNGDGYFRYYTTSQKTIALYKLEATAEFETLTTDASFKLGYTDGEVTSAKLRFGTTMSKALFESLDGMGAVYGFDVTSGDDARDIYDETWKPASTNGGAQYKFSIVIGDFNEDWSKEFTAKVYVQIGDVKYYTQAVTYSVNSLATVYKTTETDPAIFAILNVLEGGAA